MFASMARSRVLEAWLAIGLCWWLVGMLLAPTSKLYHQILILLFWLPGVLAFLMRPEVRRGWWQPLAVVLTGFSLWSMLSAYWVGNDVEITEFKIFFYLFLALNAFLALACLNFLMLRQTLALSGLLVGLLGWISVLYFYGWQGNGWQSRAVAMGIVNHPILAGHLFGAMGILLVYLRGDLPAKLQGVVWWIGCAGVLAFLLMCQSNGPWLAAAITLIVMALWTRTRRSISIVAVVAVLATLVTLIWPELIFKRGFSYRPELFAQAFKLIQEAPLLGLGYGADYSLLVPSSGLYFEHAHNIYLHIAVVLGGVGLLFWLIAQLFALQSAWLSRHLAEGQALAALILFAGLALFTDGVGPWVKPREEWFTLWLPLCLAMALMSRRAIPQVERSDE